MKDKRPVNLDIGTIHLPLAALTSITHRISGVILFAGIAILLWLFQRSLETEASFNEVRAFFESPLLKFIVWGTLSALCYHMVAGVKHLLLDAGIGETREGGPLGARIVIAVSAVLIIMMGAWIW